MKKIISFVFAAFVSASFLFAADFSAEVVSVSGKAEVLAESGWKPIVAGDLLKSGDMIQTGFRSSVVIKAKDSTVNVSQLTRMTVEQLSENSDKDNVSLFVKTGGISSDVKKTDSKKIGFTVRTPVATASVRGTEFSVYNKFNSTDVDTKRGSVAVWRGNNSVKVFSESESPVSYENSPHGAVFVGPRQGIGLTPGRMITPQRTVASGEFRVRGETRPFGETSAGQKNFPVPETTGEVPAKTANLTVKITIED